MFKAIKDNKIIAVSDTDSEFICLVKDEIVEDTEHAESDYTMCGEEFVLTADIPAPSVEEQNEAIRQTRASLYANLVDPLHAEKQRKVVLGTWTEEMEAEYVAKVQELTEQIQTENPYAQETVDIGW